MKRLGHYLFVQQRHNWLLLFRFGLVGGSGVVVNLLVFGLVKHLWVDAGDVLIDLPFTEKAVRWYHLYSTIAFLFANVWNFQLNRHWTFASGKHAGWWKEYAPFVAVGFMGQFINLVVLTLLLHEGSPVELSGAVWNGDSILRDRALFAQFVAVLVVTPISFVLNKVWVFRSVRGVAGGRGT